MAKAPNVLFFSGSSNPDLSIKIANLLNLPLGKIQIKRFPDNEIAIEIEENVREVDVFVFQTIALHPNEYLMELLIIVDALKRASARKITAVIPFLGYGRQDRQDKPNVPITARLVANLLETAGVDQLITADLHAEQIQGFFNIPVDNLHCMPVLFEEINSLNLDEIVVATPDIGSVKLLRDVVMHFNVEMAIVNKKRLKNSKVQTLQVIGDVKGKNVLLADDMCSTGATIASAAKAFQEKGAKKVLACVTHGLFVDNAFDIISQSPIESLITTDTVPFSSLKGQKLDFLKVVSSASLFAHAIKRHISFKEVI